MHHSYFHVFPLTAKPNHTYWNSRWGGVAGDESPALIERMANMAVPSKPAARVAGDESPALIERVRGHGNHDTENRVLPGTSPRLSLNGPRFGEVAVPDRLVLPGTSPRLSLNAGGRREVGECGGEVLPGTSPRLSLNGLPVATKVAGAGRCCRGRVPGSH